MGALPIPASGSLKEHSVARLLQVALEEQLSGSLTVSRGDITRTLYLKRGMITYATSTESRDRLGEIFVLQGKLSRAEVVRAFRKARRRNTLLGRVLLVDGLITSQELFLAVTAQVVTILERMKSWRKGNFRFETGSEPEMGTVLLRIPLSLYLGVEDKRRKPPPSWEEDLKETEGEEEAPEGFEFVVEGEDEELPIDESDIQAAAAEDDAAPETAPPDMVQDEDGTWGEAEAPGDEGGLGKRERGAKEEVRIIEEIVFNVQEIRRRSGRGARTLLGISDEATPGEVQDAYQYLARLLHPDHHPRGLPEDAAREAEELFQEVTAAYQDLAASVKAPASREAVPTHPPPPGRTMAPAQSMVGGDNTRRLFYRAKEQIAKGNYWQATDSLRQVVRKKPREAMYRNLLGFCLMQTGRRLHEAEEHIREAIRLDPGNPDYVTNLGLVYKAGRFHSKAKDMFQQALIYDKRHEIARRELKIVSRMIEPAGGRPIWKKIFGK